MELRFVILLNIPRKAKLSDIAISQKSLLARMHWLSSEKAHMENHSVVHS